MDNVEELMATFSMVIGLVVATFFLNTGRGLQAVMLGEECLNFLKSDELEDPFSTYHGNLYANVQGGLHGFQSHICRKICQGTS